MYTSKTSLISFIILHFIHVLSSTIHLIQIN